MIVSSEKPRTKASRHNLRQDVGTRWTGKGTPGDVLRRPGVDEDEGAEAQGGPMSKKGPCSRPSDPLKFVETHDVPLPGAPTIGVLYLQQ
jgi:hypothetical protein